MGPGSVVVLNLPNKVSGGFTSESKEGRGSQKRGVSLNLPRREDRKDLVIRCRYGKN